MRVARFVAAPGIRYATRSYHPAAIPIANGTPPPNLTKGLDTVRVHFLDPNVDGPPRRFSADAPVGSTIVDVAKTFGIDIHAACGQKLQCATCHVILEKPVYDKLHPPGVREEDLLDSTFTLTPTSRLGCQVRLTPELDGIQCTLPTNKARGSVRMSMEQERPKVTKSWTAVPAVQPLPGRSRVMSPGPEGNSLFSAGALEDLDRLRQDLEQEKALTARLESELRQVWAKIKVKGRGSDAMERVKEAAKNTNTEDGGDGDDKDDLTKLKAELERTRVDLSKAGRRVEFQDVIGLERAKQMLQEAIIWPAIADETLFSGIRGSARGLLMYGPPGCGKTMLARAAAVELGERASFFHVQPGDVMSKFYGDSQKRILALEELVKESAPAVIFFDEVDSLLSSRDGSNMAEHHRATTTALLTWMDGFSSGSDQVFFLGATNRAEAIDEAALRRFGDAVEVTLPCKESRFALIHHLCIEKSKVNGHRCSMNEADIEAVASDTDGYSLADVDRLVRRAFLQVIREIPGGVKPGLRPSDVSPVTLSHFKTVLGECRGTSALRDMLRKKGQARAQL
mmetsp:Transcript_88022/g.139023  ORF Transcript_88022/g.139023 Transcript_88022/m.139023 type:complete len:568 (-) Transcript_88022:172-1875(-)|eukprot:CAMPEP_0169090678 /NCGR_PEP_ID=MMETSP1015-20121227/15949_1 /TAXON_ID=342587 /ORGANISM="Karlodinium micrum, Strain CCMP2283" /LENGTH=567 /DNA_ID=CAMNT_0009151103 /DNA_START=65 /DNA_END=1768 /DNA_ORIENTATION=+